jgi:hypothetical protein
LADVFFPEELAFTAVELEPAPAPGTVQTRAKSLPTLSDRLRFGGPLVTQIDGRYRPDDEDLQAFIRGNKDMYRFALALVAVDFPSYDGPPLAGAEVSVRLRDDGNPSQTIAYSVLPAAAGSPYELSRGYNIGPSLKIGPIGVSGKDERTTVEHGERTYVSGGGELTPNVAWTFQPTPTQQLSGSTRLSLVIRVPAARIGQMSVDVGATIEEGLFRKRRIPLPGATSDTPGTVDF